MKRALLGGAALLLLGLVAAGIYGGLRYRQGQDVRGSSTEEFTPTEVAPPAPPEPGVFWPEYGFDPERHHVADYRHRPPYKIRWFFRARTLSFSCTHVVPSAPEARCNSPREPQRGCKKKPPPSPGTSQIAKSSGKRSKRA